MHNLHIFFTILCAPIRGVHPSARAGFSAPETRFYRILYPRLHLIPARETLPGKRTMNKLFLSLAALLIATLVQAQPTSSSPDPKTGVEMTGTIKEYTPGTALVLETVAPSEPVHFRLSKTITYADADGKPIEAAGLTTNQKVRVHYTKVAGDNVADKISLIGN
jgi:hypothetical protein